MNMWTARLFLLLLAAFASSGSHVALADDGAAILQDLPAEKADVVEQIDRCIKDLKQVDAPSQRVQFFRQLFANETVREQRLDVLQPLVEKTMGSLPSNQLPSFAHVVNGVTTSRHGIKLRQGRPKRLAVRVV